MGLFSPFLSDWSEVMLAHTPLWVIDQFYFCALSSVQPLRNFVPAYGTFYKILSKNHLRKETIFPAELTFFCSRVRKCKVTIHVTVYAL